MAIKGGRFGRIFNDIPTLIGYISLTVLIYSICKNRFKIVKNIILYIGKLSYELYLTHMFAFVLLNDFLTRILILKSNIFFILYVLPVSLLVAYIFMVVTRPFYKKQHSG